MGFAQTYGVLLCKTPGDDVWASPKLTEFCFAKLPVMMFGNDVWASLELTELTLENQTKIPTDLKCISKNWTLICPTFGFLRLVGIFYLNVKLKYVEPAKEGLFQISRRTSGTCHLRWPSWIRLQSRHQGLQRQSRIYHGTGLLQR